MPRTCAVCLKNVSPSSIPFAESQKVTPGVRPLETLHNSLSLRQLDSFLGYVTSANFKAPNQSPPLRLSSGGSSSGGGNGRHPPPPPLAFCSDTGVGGECEKKWNCCTVQRLVFLKTCHSCVRKRKCMLYLTRCRSLFPILFSPLSSVTGALAYSVD